MHAAVSSVLRLILTFRQRLLDIIECKKNPDFRISNFLKLQPIIKEMAVVQFL